MDGQALRIKFNNLSAFLRFSILTLSGAVFSFNAIAASVGCNDAFVKLLDDDLVIEVAPNHSDDTVNLQCALDAAVSMGVPTVKLRAASYAISNIMVENFKGTLEGKTSATTIVQIMDNSIDCVAMLNSGREAAAIKFVEGEPRIRFMTINSHQACMGEIDQLWAVLHFTGGATSGTTSKTINTTAATTECGNDVIFGAVDRVIIDGTSNDKKTWGAIQATPEGWVIGGCKDTLLGTFKLNRSIIRNVSRGIVTGMRGGGQVDINFNEFINNSWAVNLFDTNQNTTITSNEFSGDNSQRNYLGINVANWSLNPPKVSRVVIHNNKFNVASTANADGRSYVISQTFAGAVSSISTVITKNVFNLSGMYTYGVAIQATSDVHVSTNHFSGTGLRAIYAYGGTPMTGWSITANTGLATFATPLAEDIGLGSNTSMFIVGPDQGATVVDDGNDNTILPQ